jgi:hypothetical protein
MQYAPRGGTKKTYSAVVEADGYLKVDDDSKLFLSSAAEYYMKQAGSTNPSVNGWEKWKNSDGVLLIDLREKYMEGEADITVIG